MKNVRHPGNANESTLDLDLGSVAAAEGVEVHAVDWNALDAMSIAPRRNDQAPAWQRAANFIALCERTTQFAEEPNVRIMEAKALVCAIMPGRRARRAIPSHEGRSA